ncbi:hypothetical protein BC937DRAFT_87367 [Endogone sp. FLAS-F59071]|nr:hypothetical protein BC937DRAFT_87367 [Endogone sp. FLAS-F59071]|eukprot:RUS19512.1 hypothetical protein BC937DRAFT_87367 [Endogone sp. FLAS-F59071]
MLHPISSDILNSAMSSLSPTRFVIERYTNAFRVIASRRSSRRYPQDNQDDSKWSSRLSDLRYYYDKRRDLQSLNCATVTAVSMPEISTKNESISMEGSLGDCHIPTREGVN